MNWYTKHIFAQSTGLENYLSTLGTTPDIINYIMSLDKNTGQILTNEIRKNPSLTLEQLQEIQQPEEIDPYLKSEKTLAANFEHEIPQFAKWILVSFRKLRRGLSWTDTFGNKIVPYGSNSSLTDQEMMMYQNFREKIPEIRDWYSSTQPNISSYSPQQAAVASDDWHKAMAGQGEGKVYETPKQENIVYGPQWQDPKKNGWTIQKVVSENDLWAEGNKMNHCVGDYCDKVTEGKTNIYSLRDPQNNPHITLEIIGEAGESSLAHKNNMIPGGTIQQIMGNSNEEPDSEYKEFIKEWLTTSGKDSGINTEVNAFEDLEEAYSYSSPGLEEYHKTIDNILRGEENEYGLKYVFDSDILTVLDEIVTEAEAKAENQRDNSYKGDITEAPPYIVNLSVMEDLKLPNWPRHSTEYQDMIKNKPKAISWENINKIENWAYTEINKIREKFIDYETGLGYPQVEDYETDEEYDEAMEQFDKAEAEVHDEWIASILRGGLAQDILKEIKDYTEVGLIYSSQEREEQQIKERQRQVELV
jgi:hypothetical protein